MAGHTVTGDQYFRLDGKLLEITRQLRQGDGYPFDPQLLEGALQAIIEGRFGPTVASAPAAHVPVILPRWCRVRLGVYQTHERIFAALEEKGVRVGLYVRQVLSKVALSAEEEDVETFLGSGRDFGFRRKTARETIFERAALNGYHPFSPELCLAARLQHTDHVLGDYRVMATTPIAHADGHLWVLYYLCNDVGTEFNVLDGRPDCEWDPDVVWAWCRKPCARG